MDYRVLRHNVRSFIRKYPETKRLINKLSNQVLTLPYIGKKIRRIKWKNEQKLLEGEDVARGEKRSIIHFSLNRSATQFIKRVLSIVAHENGIMHVDWSSFAANSKHPYVDHLDKDGPNKYKNIFKPRGYLYGPFGSYVDIIDESISEYKVLLIIRDPRDVLISNYYSKKYSHIIPASEDEKTRLIKEREMTNRLDLSEWIIEKKSNLKKRLNEYKNKIQKERKNVHVSQFEEMISDFGKWIKQISRHCNLELTNDTMKKVKKMYENNSKSKEDKKSRNRKGVHRDFEDKLSKSVISELNEYFSDELNYFGYDR